MLDEELEEHEIKAWAEAEADFSGQHQRVTLVRLDRVDLRRAPLAHLLLPLPPRHPPPMRRRPPRLPPTGDSRYKGSIRSPRKRKEDHAAEGDRESSCRRQILAYPERRRACVCKEAKGLVDGFEQEGLGAGGQDCPQRALEERRALHHPFPSFPSQHLDPLPHLILQFAPFRFQLVLRAHPLSRLFPRSFLYTL